MSEIGRRVFSATDQRAFAVLSGDANPLHMDEAVARRTVFGHCVVHGVHQVLWALEAWLAGRGENGALEWLDAKFLRGLGIGVEVACRVEQQNGAEFVLGLSTSDGVAARVQGRWRASPAENTTVLPATGPELACRVRSFEDVVGAHGRMELILDKALEEEMFPALALRLPPAQLTGLLATTRLVGMECPGWHSIFSALRLEFGTPRGDAALEWRVERAEPRLSIIQIAVESPGMKGTLHTLFRPPPRAQAALAEVAAQVTPGEFAGQRALVIGGSRGLGEVAAKIIVCGGGQVFATYLRGAEDAQRLCAELRTAEPGAAVAAFDVLSGDLPALPWIPTHLYFFATPAIAADRGDAFSAGKFEEYSRCYVSGLARVLDRVAQLSGGAVSVFYPSTIFLDQPAAGFAAYAAAKAAGEALGAQFAARFPRMKFHAPRLPRLSTDQTSGLLPVAAQEPLAALLAAFRAIHAA